MVREERQLIAQALQKYANEHKAQYYLLIVTPAEAGFNKHVFRAQRGDIGTVVDSLVLKEVLAKGV